MNYAAFSNCKLYKKVISYKAIGFVRKKMLYVNLLKDK